MESNVEENEACPKEKPITARILSSADFSSMISGTPKGLPIKVPTIPIKVVTTNGTQASSTLTGVIVAKPSPLSPGSSAAPMMRSTGATNLIFKGKAIPLLLEKSKSPTTASATATPINNLSENNLVSQSSLQQQQPPSKVPNILRGTSSSSKNTIDRQIVSHEATIEFRKNCNILSRPLPSNVVTLTNSSTVPQVQTPSTTKLGDSPSIAATSVNNGIIPKSPPKHLETVSDAATKSPSEMIKKSIEMDLLQPLLRSEDNIDEEVDLAGDLDNLKCNTNEFGALVVSTPGESNSSSQTTTNELEADADSDLDLICRETVQITPPKPVGNNTTTKNETSNTSSSGANNAIMSKDVKVRDDDILCCGGCGCYGMAGEFFTTEACSNSCQNRIVQKNREKEKKERELAIQKQRREQRKREQKEAKEKEEHQKMNSSNNIVQSTNAVDAVDDTNHDESDDEDEEDNDEDEDEEEDEKLPFDSPHPWLDNSKGFSWARYLECTNSRGAPAKLFSDPFPSGANLFKIGHRFEAIDPEHPALICVASVAQVQGFRILVHFDGFNSNHDFWVNANSRDIFPAGWCESHRQKLLPPPGYQLWSWNSYNAKAAPKEAFYHFKKPPRPHEVAGFKIGQKLECFDGSSFCVATVTNVMDGRILVHFDGWEIDFDYWSTPSSPKVRPKGWCSENGIVLNKPKGYRGEFAWERYLEETRSKPVPQWAFKNTKNDSSQFRKGMKIEVVDRWNPVFVRVATISDVANRQVKIHFDGWPDTFDFWTEDDSPDLHPVSWCSKTGHPLIPPLTIEEVSYYMAKKGCQTPGCRGLGHARGYEQSSHDRFADCPYSPQNIANDALKPDRIKSMRTEKRSISAEEFAIITTGDNDNNINNDDTNNPDEPPSPVGRGNRKRKKRKFFDEVPNKKSRQIGGAAGANSAGIGNNNKISNGFHHVIRHNVFSPDHLAQRSQWEHYWDQNTSFLKPMTQSLNPTIVEKWTPREVAKFIVSLPRLSNCVMSNLEMKILEEELDGEAFLLMTQSDFARLGVKLGSAIKIYNALLLIKKSSS